MESDDLLPLSGLQHVVFCERQAALIHVEQLWRDDVATVQGNIVHERVHEPGAGSSEGVRVVRALPLVSHRLGVSGISDMVELALDEEAPHGVRPTPVEVKKGATKIQPADEVQLCAQAMCLEEMFEVEVSEGFLYYSASHRRRRVEIGTGLRDRTVAAAVRFRELVARREVPRPVVHERVRAVCSLEPLCLPGAMRDPGRARKHLRRLARSDD